MKKGTSHREIQKMRKWADDEGIEIGNPMDNFHALNRNVEEVTLLRVSIH